MYIFMFSYPLFTSTVPNESIFFSGHDLSYNEGQSVGACLLTYVCLEFTLYWVAARFSALYDKAAMC